MIGLETKGKTARWTRAYAFACWTFLVLLVAFVLQDSVIGWTLCQSPSTKAIAEVSEIRKAVVIHLTLTGEMPRTLADLRRPQERNGGEALIEIGDDPWGHPYGFTLDGPRAFTVICLGSDGAFGGEGDAADVIIRDPGNSDPETTSTARK